MDTSENTMNLPQYQIKYKSINAIRNIDGVCSINVSTTESLVWYPTHSHTYQCSCQPLMQFSVTACLQHLEGPKRRKREPSAQYLSIVFQLAFDYPFLLSSLLASYPGSFTQHGRGNEPGNEATPLSLSLSLSLIHSSPPLLYSPSTTLVSHLQSLQGQIPGGLGNHLPDTPLQLGTSGPHCAPSDEGTPGVWVWSLNDVQVHV